MWNVQERSERAERTNRSEDAKRQAAVQKGKYVEVRKHSSMGCAVVTMKDMRVRQAILNAGLEATIAGIHVKLKPHFEKDTRKEVMTDLFVGWGRQAEKATPLPEAELVHFFDQKHEELCNSGCLDELARGAPQQAPVKDVQSEQQQMPMVPDAAIVAVVRGNTQGAPPAGAAAPPHMQTPVPAAVPQQPLQAQQAQEAQQAQQHAAMMQAAQAQWHAQMQAQWAAQWAAHAQMQQQQHQQALAYAAAMANPPAAPGKGQRREFKPAYRRPTDEEIQAQFKSVVALPKAQDTTPHVTDEQILAKVRSVIAPGKAQGSAPGAEQAPGQDVSEGGC